MKTKEELVQRDIVELVAACMAIATANPRTEGKSSPLLKAVRSFSRALESMEPEETMAMARSFYSKHYLASLGGEGWLEGDVDLAFGESDPDLCVRLRVSQYARVAKDMAGLPYATLQYHALRLLQHLASKSVAESLDERIQPLEKKLGKSPLPTPAAGAGAGLGSIVTTLMSSVGPMLQQLTSGDDSPLKQLLATPGTANMMRGMAASLPPELRAGMEPMLKDMEQGRLDINKILERAVGAAPPAGPIDLVLRDAEPPPIRTDDIVVPALPDGLLAAAEGAVCDGDVCLAPEN
jgi:hypothetical protein